MFVEEVFVKEEVFVEEVFVEVFVEGGRCCGGKCERVGRNSRPVFIKQIFLAAIIFFVSSYTPRFVWQFATLTLRRIFPAAPPSFFFVSSHNGQGLPPPTREYVRCLPP